METKQLMVGDVLTISTKDMITRDQAQLLQEKFHEQFGCPVVILSGGLELGVVSRMSNMVKDIEEFHRKFGIEYNGKPRMIDESLLDFRTDFMLEELDEYLTAAHEMLAEIDCDVEADPGMMILHMEKMLDALVDLVYVALGTAHLHGFDFNEAWRRVHAANMKKIRTPSAEASKESTGRGHAFDVIKPPGWEAPSHKDLVEDHAHQPLTETEKQLLEDVKDL